MATPPEYTGNGPFSASNQADFTYQVNPNFVLPYVDTQAQDQGLSLEDLLTLFGSDSGGGGGGYGGPGADYYNGQLANDTARVGIEQARLGLDTDIFGFQKGQQDWENSFNQSKFEWQKAMDERNWALAQGDLALAQKKQDDANYWQAMGMAQDMQIAKMRTAADTQQASIAAAATTAAAQAGADAQRYAADAQKQVGLGGVVNDYNNMLLNAARAKDEAAAAKMDDYRKGQSNQVAGFGAETERAGTMGNLALANNQFILNAATSPKDLFGLYFMQRGITPDWQGLANGQVTQGDPLKVYDPMKAYVPQTQMPTDFMSNPFQNQVGAATGAFVPVANQYAGLPGASTNQSSTSQTSSTSSSSRPRGGMFGRRAEGGYTRAKEFMVGDSVHPNPWFGGAMPEMIHNPEGAKIKVDNSAQTYADFGVKRYATGSGVISNNPTMNTSGYKPQYGFDLSKGMPTFNYMGNVTGYTPWGNVPGFGGMNIKPPQLSAPATNAPLTLPPQYRAAVPSIAGGMPEGGGQFGQNVPGMGSTTFVDYGYQPKMVPPGNLGGDMGTTFGNGGVDPQQAMWIERQNAARNAWSRARQLNNPDPLTDRGMSFMTGPTGGPRIVTSGRNQFGNILGGNPIQIDEASIMAGGGIPRGGMGGGYGRNPMEAILSQFQSQFRPQALQQPAQPVATQPAVTQPAQQPAQTQPVQTRTEQTMPAPNVMGNPFNQWMNSNANGGNNFNNYRFALGTDVSQDYSNLGLGGLYQQSSQNQHLNGMELPSQLRMLADYGAPVAPALAQGVTGGQLGTLNLADAWRQRGGGMLPSMQGLRNMSPGERGMMEGFSGVVGMPWNDVMDFLGRPTANLQGAQRARGGLF